MVPDQRFAATRIGFDDDKVEAERERRHHRAVGQRGAVDQPVACPMEKAPLAMVDRLLREPEIAPPAPTNLDDHEGPGRARVGRHEVDLVTADMDVPGKNGPASRDQPIGRERFGGISRLLRRRSDPGR
jgi:hypothetical protein